MCENKSRKHKETNRPIHIITKQSIHSLVMVFSSSFSSSTITSKFIGFLLLISLTQDLSLASALHHKNNTSFRPNREIQKHRRVEAYLNSINKPSIKTIHVTKHIYPFLIYPLFLVFFPSHDNIFVTVKLQSPDGDVIECVLSHLQPAFDHPQLRGQKPLVMKLLFHLT